MKARIPLNHSFFPSFAIIKAPLITNTSTQKSKMAETQNFPSKPTQLTFNQSLQTASIKRTPISKMN